jgi:hypothetical protein
VHSRTRQMDSKMHNGPWFSEVESCIDLISAKRNPPAPLLWSLQHVSTQHLLTQHQLSRHQGACFEPFSWWRMKPSFVRWLAKSCRVQATAC